jgi:hypothetical protein
VRSEVRSAKIDALYVGVNHCERFFEVLQSVAARVVVARFNPFFPPPLTYRQQWNSSTRATNDPATTAADDQFFLGGCSLSEYDRIAVRHGYWLLQVNLFNAVWVESDNLFLFGDIPHDAHTLWSVGFFQQPFVRILRDSCTTAVAAAVTPAAAATSDGCRYWPRFSLLTKWAASAMALASSNEQCEAQRDQLVARVAWSLLAFYDIERPRDYTLSAAPRRYHSLSFQQRAPKLFCYLTQSAAQPQAEFHVMRSANSDALHLSWKEQANDTMFLSDSTWTTGRNYLVTLAQSRFGDGNKNNDGGGNNYLYYFMLDGDSMIRTASGLNAFRAWEKSLMQHLPAFAGAFNRFGAASQIEEYQRWPLSRQFREFQGFFNVDAAAVAVHAEAAARLLPYNSTYDSQSWWYSQLFFLHRTHVLFPYSSGYVTAAAVRNMAHDKSYPKGHDWERFTHEVFGSQLPDALKPCIAWTNAQKTVAPFQKPKQGRYDAVSYWNVLPCDHSSK